MSDSKNGYGTVTKAFHWAMALLVGWQLLKLGDRIADGEHWVGQVLVPWHVSIGVLLLALAIPRIPGRSASADSGRRMTRPWPSSSRRGIACSMPGWS